MVARTFVSVARIYLSRNPLFIPFKTQSSDLPIALNVPRFTFDSMRIGFNFLHKSVKVCCIPFTTPLVEESISVTR